MGPVIRMVDGGTPVLTPFLLGWILGPPRADPAHLHVSVGRPDRYLSTPALDRAANRLGGHDPFPDDRKVDRDLAVGRGGRERSLEIAREGGLHVAVRGAQVHGPARGQLSQL